ncbi:MAG: CRTAC1 family protein, partial [Planctomycetota bacterium]
KWRDHGRGNALFLNDGGRWREVALKMPRTSLHAACTCDYDRDGKLDLFLGSGYVVYGHPGLESHPDRLYRGNGDGTFVEVTQAAGLATRPGPGDPFSSKPTYGVTHGDWDGDGWQDLWVCTYGRQWNHLWWNRVADPFVNVAPATGFDGDEDRSGKYPEWMQEWWKGKFGQRREDEQPFRANGNTFDCAVADYDNDGDMDCILAEITHAWAGSSSDRTSLLVNIGERFERRPFERTHTTERWNQGDIHCGWIDYDNDGRLDALIASSDYPDLQELKFYRQRPDHSFEPPRTFGWEGAGQISVGDYDLDGDLDILVGRSLNRLPKEKRQALGVSCALFRNDVGNRNHWLQVVCVGKTANRDGIGCRVRVTTEDGVTQTREIRGGLGHAGHNGPYVAHFGLGGHTRADRVEVFWPDRAGQTTVRRGVPADQRLRIAQ